MKMERFKDILRRAREALSTLKPSRRGLDPDRWRYYRYLK